MAAYISVVFEKDRLSTSEQVRVIVRNRDDGSVPPLPSPTYFPTEPDDLRAFIVGQFINSVNGDMFTRIAALADISGVTIRELDTFQDLSANFTGAGVVPGDLLAITLPDPQLWTSDEYTDTNPHIFQVSSVLSATKLVINRPFPAFATGLAWAISARSISGTTGTTLRNGSPADGSFFRAHRYNRLYSTAVTAENSVTAMKADITALTNETVGSTLTTETVTIGSTI